MADVYRVERTAVGKGSAKDGLGTLLRLPLNGKVTGIIRKHHHLAVADPFPMQNSSIRAISLICETVSPLAGRLPTLPEQEGLLQRGLAVTFEPRPPRSPTRVLRTARLERSLSPPEYGRVAPCGAVLFPLPIRPASNT